MDSTIQKFQRLHTSVQKLETVLQEVWSVMDELAEDQEFKNLKNRVKQSKKSGENLADLSGILDEFQNSIEEIPEDGTAAVDLEDAIAELIDWLENQS
ncbi:hypothetical protein [Neobacillus sp. D3-1R]|uniref:hypothetical protein n=1 Tax=Neobacillus sp. D3-1R TaxID=3445778 RepID=UPI003F9EBAC2